MVSNDLGTAGICCAYLWMRIEMPSEMLAACLWPDESLADRLLRLDHAGENGAVSIYAGQMAVARWTAPAMLDDLARFQADERRHRALFAAELQRRGLTRCKSFTICAVGGYMLGLVTGLLGRPAIAATTVAVEKVVLRHLERQITVLSTSDAAAARTVSDIVAEETAHRDGFDAQRGSSLLLRPIQAIVSASAELAIWLGMRL